MNHTCQCSVLNSAHSAIDLKVDVQIPRQWFSTLATQKNHLQSFLKTPVFESHLKLIKFSGGETWALWGFQRINAIIFTFKKWNWSQEKKKQKQRTKRSIFKHTMIKTLVWFFHITLTEWKSCFCDILVSPELNREFLCVSL